MKKDGGHSNELVLCFSFLLFLVFAVFVNVSAAYAHDRSSTPHGEKQILILMGPHYGLPMLEEIAPAIVGTLKDNGVRLDDIFVEYLDLHRNTSFQHRSNVLTLLEYKLKKRNIGLIIAVNQGAVDFVAREGRELFPGAPMLIPILEELPSWEGSPRKLMTLSSRQDAEGTLKYALDLFPETKRVLLIMGRDDRQPPFLAPILEALNGKPLKLETTADLSHEEMLQRVASLPGDAIALYGYVFHDVTGRSFVPAEVARRVAAAANRPVFAFRDMHIAQGLTGGSVAMTSKLGEQAALIGLDYLRGSLHLTQPVTAFDAPHIPLFDWQQVKHWGGNPNKLPAETIFLNRPPALWDEHRDAVIITLVSFTLLFVLVVALVIKNRRQIIAIRKREEAEHALRESESLLAQSQKIAQIGSWRLDLARGNLVWSDETYRIFGLEPQVVPVSYDVFLDFVHPDDRAAVDTAYTSSVREGKDSYETEHRIVRKDTGDVRTVYEKCTHRRDATGTIVHSIGMVQDITERRRAEVEREKLQGQLIQAQKMESVGRLAGGVAHDFNNMLCVILGQTELALEGVSPSEPLHAELEEIQKAAKRSADLTRQLLAFARKQAIAPEVIDLNETIQNMLEVLRRLIGENIDLLWEPGHGIWPVRMDPSQIDQILTNLCVNARDAIADVGKVTIETDNVVFEEQYCSEHAGFLPGEYTMLAVSDNGCGMDTETLTLLFEPFFTTKELGKGTGLGLATVEGVVKQNNGFLNVYSEPGQGTTFKVYLPRHAVRSAEPKKHRPQAAERGTETILLVEDEPAILRMTTKMLERLGYTVLATSTPGDAIRLAQEHAGPIDLVMTDVVMPKMNGRDLANNLLPIRPDLRLLFMSGYTSNVIAHHGVLDEGVHFIQKPFAIGGLAVKLQQALND